MNAPLDIAARDIAAPLSVVQEFRYDRARLSKYAVISGIFVLVAALLNLSGSLTFRSRVALDASGAFFALCGVLILWRMFATQVAFSISPAGFHWQGFAETIAWRDVLAVSRTKFKSSDWLKLIIVPSVANTLTPAGTSKFFAQWIGLNRRSVDVPLNMLDCDPDRVTAQCAAYVHAAHEEIRALGQQLDVPVLAEFKPHLVWLTYVLLVVLATVYAAELQFAVNANSSGAPSLLTLAYLGGLLSPRIWTNMEWWRLFTAPLLHGSPTHLLFNGIVLWSAGTALERLVGWRWLGAIFALSALAGSFASLLINPPNMVGVGASGGIMGLLSALFVVSSRLPDGPIRMQLQMRAIQTIIPALLPFLSDFRSGMNIDYAAHAGGAATGVLVALLLRQIWPRERPEPRFSLAAGAVTLLFFLVATAALIPIVNLLNE